MKIIIEKRAEKDILKLSKELQLKISREILNLKNFPNISNIKKLTNFFPPFRYRVGDYRILFNVEQNLIKIYRVLHRRESYK